MDPGRVLELGQALRHLVARPRGRAKRHAEARESGAPGPEVEEREGARGAVGAVLDAVEGPLPLLADLSQILLGLLRAVH